MPKSASPPGMRTCRKCGPRPASEFDRLPGRWDYYCRACREAAKPPAPISLGDGRSKIPLSGRKGSGLFQVVDDADLPILGGRRWWAHGRRRPDGSWSHGPYAVTVIDGKWISAHQLLTGKNGIDHNDRDPLNNTRKNLRGATHAEQGANQGKRRSRHGIPTSKYKGVHKQTSVGKWHVNFGINGGQRYLGLYVDEDAAGYAHDAAVLKHRREHGVTNIELGLLPPLPPGTILECKCWECEGRPDPARRRRLRADRELPADLTERLSPELRATLEEQGGDEDGQAASG